MSAADHDVAEYDVDAVQELITEALGATGLLPTMQRLTELDEQLRTVIERLMPVVQQWLDQVPPRTREWYALDRALVDAREVLTFQRPTRPLAASIQVAELARKLHALRHAAAEAEDRQP